MLDIYFEGKTVFEVARSRKGGRDGWEKTFKEGATTTKKTHSWFQKNSCCLCYPWLISSREAKLIPSPSPKYCGLTESTQGTQSIPIRINPFPAVTAQCLNSLSPLPFLTLLFFPFLFFFSLRNCPTNTPGLDWQTQLLCIKLVIPQRRGEEDEPVSPFFPLLTVLFNHKTSFFNCYCLFPLFLLLISVIAMLSSLHISFILPLTSLSKAWDQTKTTFLIWIFILAAMLWLSHTCTLLCHSFWGSDLSLFLTQTRRKVSTQLVDVTPFL